MNMDCDMDYDSELFSLKWNIDMDLKWTMSFGLRNLDFKRYCFSGFLYGLISCRCFV